MNPNFIALLIDAWRSFRREADLVLRIAGALVFLPAFAVQLLCDPLPALPTERDERAMQAWLDAVSAWGQGNAFWYVAADLLGMIGLATVALLLLDRRAPSVRDALAEVGRRLPRFILANLLVAIPVGLGLWLFILPGLYLQARLIAAIPALAAEHGLSAARAVRRSWGMTAGSGWAILGAIVALFLLQWLIVSPLLPAETWLRTPGHENPFVIALVAALLAAASTAYNLALLLLGVVAYRRWASIGT